MTEKLTPSCHVTNGQLKCDHCGHRLRTKPYLLANGHYTPMYPYCPWCGAPVTVEAQELERRKKR